MNFMCIALTSKGNLFSISSIHFIQHSLGSLTIDPDIKLVCSKKMACLEDVRCSLPITSEKILVASIHSSSTSSVLEKPTHATVTWVIFFLSISAAVGEDEHMVLLSLTTLEGVEDRNDDEDEDSIEVKEVQPTLVLLLPSVLPSTGNGNVMYLTELSSILLFSAVALLLTAVVVVAALFMCPRCVAPL